MLLAACKSTPPQDSPPAVPEPVTEIKEPSFTITEIKILQADLINTRLKLTLLIHNPNSFPITLSLFHYELYGDGSFWTSGMAKDLAVVPAQNIAETNFTIDMNFIGMKRRLLDDVIAMREVRYRIMGSMELGTDIPSLPGFRMEFDKSGNSAVIQ